MYFKYPELLYALFLLVIPLLVHLFQLRRFRTTEFTNVKFLKKAVLQTRKSSRLKKFLILCTRLLLLACIIIAFAQPYFPPASGEVEETETVIYLDNSYSMQAKGKNGILLKRSVQDLLENMSTQEPVTLFTNEEEFRNMAPAALKQRLQALNYSPTQLTWDIVQLKAKSFFTNSSRQKNFLAISDFQNIPDSVYPISEDSSTFLVQLEHENNLNLTVDSVFVSSRSLGEMLLKVEISASEKMQEEVSLGLYNGDRLLARKTIELDPNLKGTTTFSFTSEALPFGKVMLDDNSLQFDNHLFFSISEPPPVNVVVIGDHEVDFLKRIFRTPEFSLEIFPEKNIDFNIMSQANLIVLNEMERIPFSMVNTLSQFADEQVFIVVIPSPNANLSEYNQLFRSLNLPAFGPKNDIEKLITDIRFDHPLYRTVFNERVTNFEYPKVNSSYPVKGVKSGILNYQDQEPFLFAQQNIFVFTAPLRQANSNFKNAPLIVPTFYNIGNLTVSPPDLYYTLGATENIYIQADLQKDEILKLASPLTTYIPQQQSYKNKVELSLENLSWQAGHYRLMKDSITLRTLSFNIDRRESLPVRNGVAAGKGVAVFSAIPDVFSTIESTTEVNMLWKWFLIFALIFLLTEVLILKFFK